MITKQELIKDIEKNLDFAKTMYEKNDNNGFAPGFIIDITKDGKSGRIVVVMTDGETTDNRFNVSFDLGVRYGIELFLKKIESINAVFMIFESWFNSMPKNGSKEKLIRPSLDPNKKEGIVSAGLTREGVSALEMFELKKTFDSQNGKIKVEFKPAFNDSNVKKQDKIEADSPLLKHFWDGVDFMEEFSLKTPPEMFPIFQKVPADKMFDIIKGHIDNLRKRYEK